MSVELHDHAPPDSVAFVMAHLMPLAQQLSGSPLARVAPKRWNADLPLPYWMVVGIDSDEDLISAFPIVRVHTFGKDYPEAWRHATDAHRRMQLIENDPLTDVQLAPGVVANGQVLRAKAPHEEPYSAETVVTRFVAEYHLELRFTPVA